MKPMCPSATSWRTSAPYSLRRRRRVVGSRRQPSGTPGRKPAAPHGDADAQPPEPQPPAGRHGPAPASSGGARQQAQRLDGLDMLRRARAQPQYPSRRRSAETRTAGQLPGPSTGIYASTGQPRRTPAPRHARRSSRLGVCNCRASAGATAGGQPAGDPGLTTASTVGRADQGDSQCRANPPASASPRAWVKTVRSAGGRQPPDTRHPFIIGLIDATPTEPVDAVCASRLMPPTAMRGNPE